MTAALSLYILWHRGLIHCVFLEKTIMLALGSSPSAPAALRALDSERGAAGRAQVVACDGVRRSSASIPKLEPFSRSRIERGVKEPSFLQKSEDDLSDYCSTLDGDESYSCWRAYFELKDLEKELPREDVEKLVRQAGGRKDLIDSVHGLTAFQKKEEKETPKAISATVEAQRERPFHIPDGLPKTLEELEEEEKARMPDSPFTRLLRSKGRHLAWYSQAPNRETD